MKRKLSFVLVLCLLLSVITPGVLGGTAKAVNFPDVGATYWGKTYIDYMSSKGVLNGYTNGTFRPDNAVNKAEFIKMLNYTFGLTKTGYSSYSDVKSSDWFYSDIMKASAQGYLTTDSSNKVRPEANLTREEAAALLARYLDLDTSSSYYSSFKDDSSISSTYKSYVIAASNAGIFNGYTDGTFRPKGAITRAEAATVFYRMAGNIMNASGTADSSLTNATINKSGVTVSNSNLTGKIYVTEGAEGGTVTFQNCYISGEVIVRGAANVVFSGCTVSTVTTDTASKASATITAQSNTNINKAVAKTSTYYVNSNTSASYGFTSIESQVPYGYSIDLTGSFNTVSVVNSGSKVNIPTASSKVANLSILQTATNTTVTGSGAITKLTVAASGANIQQMPASYTISGNLSATIAGSARTGTGSGTSVGYPQIALVNSQLQMRVKNDYAGTTYYIVVAQGSAAPTAAQVKARTYYNGVSIIASGSTYSAANAETTLTSSTLTTGRYYDLYVYSEQSSGGATGTVNKYSVYATASPAFSAGYPQLGTKSTTSYNAQFSIPITLMATSNCTAYVIAVPSNSTAPTAQQLIDAAQNGTAYNSYVTIAARATQALYSGSASTVTLSGLNNSQSYTYYVVLSNNAEVPAISSVVNAANSATGNTGFVGTPTIYNNGTATTLYYTPQYTGGSVYYVQVPSTVTSLNAATFMTYYNTTSVRGVLPNNTGAGVAQTAYLPFSTSVYNVALLYVDATGNYTTYTPVVLGQNINLNSGFSTGYPYFSAYGGTGYYVMNLMSLYGGTVYYAPFYSTLTPSAQDIVNAATTGSANSGYGTLQVYNSYPQSVYVPSTYANTYYKMWVVLYANGQYYTPVGQTVGTTGTYPTVSAVKNATSGAFQLTFSQPMYYTSTSYPLATYGAISSLFTVKKDGAVIANTNYTVTASTGAYTVVTITPTSAWAAGTYQITVNPSVVNASSLAPVTKSYQIVVTGPTSAITVTAPTGALKGPSADDTITLTLPKALKGVSSGDIKGSIDKFENTTDDDDIGSSSFEAAYSNTNDEYKITITTKALEYGKTYKVKLDSSLEYSDSSDFDTYTFNFTTYSQPTATLTSAATNAAIDGNVVVSFSRTMYSLSGTVPATLTNAKATTAFKVYAVKDDNTTETSAESGTTATISTSSGKTVVTIQIPSSNKLEYNKKYRVVIDPSVTDEKGVAAIPASLDFTTKKAPAPTGTLDNKNVIKGSVATITFDQALMALDTSNSPVAINGSTIKIEDLITISSTSGEVNGWTAGIDSDKKVITISAANVGVFACGTKYTIQLSRLCNGDGVAIAKSSYDFTTPAAAPAVAGLTFAQATGLSADATKVTSTATGTLYYKIYAYDASVDYSELPKDGDPATFSIANPEWETLTLTSGSATISSVTTGKTIAVVEVKDGKIASYSTHKLVAGEVGPIV